MNDRLPSAWAEIDLSAIAHNVRTLRALLSPPAQLMAVVKANAYGHGALPVARTALQYGATWLGVARVGEALELRASAIDAPILLLGPISPAEAADAVRTRSRVALASVPVARALSEQSQAQGVITPVHVKIDTGMSRFGVPLDQVVETARAILSLPALQLEGVFTHLHSDSLGACGLEVDQWAQYASAPSVVLPAPAAQSNSQVILQVDGCRRCGSDAINRRAARVNAA